MSMSDRPFHVPQRPSAIPVRYVAWLAYDGTDYVGWQVQPHGRSIQGELEAVIERLTGCRTRAHASGRTDAGVHAHEQPVHFDLPTQLDLNRFLLGLNALLPADIRVWRVRTAPLTFHARYSALAKEYRYHIYNGPVWDPCLRRYTCWERRPLDLDAMRAAAKHLVGQHDFAAFAANPHREVHGTVRTLWSLDVHRRGPLVTIVARADGFLYRMVRSLAGFLLRVGRNEVPPATAEAILHSRVRTARVPTAAPQGLFLWKVQYPRNAFHKTNARDPVVEHPSTVPPE
jgi:tRNA pseudouridine38-40 synthase